MSDLGSIACKIRHLNHLRQFHAHLIQNSLHSHNLWVLVLIQHCTHLRAPHSYTLSIFNSSLSPNVSLFSSMLTYYSLLGGASHHCHAFSLFARMRHQASALSSAPFLYPVLIKLAGKAAVPIHALILKLGHVHHAFVRNSVINMYAKHGPIHLARQVFDEMPERAIADWNSLISGYLKQGNEAEARLLFDLMPEKNVITWTTMVTGYASMKDLGNARKFFEQMPDRSVVSWNAMLSAYARNGFVEKALELFDAMINTGVQADETTWVIIIYSCALRGDPSLADSIVRKLDQQRILLNCFLKTALLDMHAKCGDLKTAQKYFDELGVRRNLVTWNAMISGHAKVGDLSMARELFDKMPERNVVSWNTMISGYAQNGQSPLAIELFMQMIATTDSIPDEVTVVGVISACGHLGALELGNRVVSFLAKNDINLSIAGYNSLIFMYSKCGSMRDAYKIFQEMTTRDVISYNTLIMGFAAHGHGTEVIKLMLKMKDEGIKPDGVTFIGILTSCSHAGLVEQGRKVFESIKEPSVDHYACMVDLLGRAGRLDEAKELIESMPIEPHAGVYGSLLNACRIHKNVELGELAAKVLFQLEPNNSGNYVLLSNIYASAGRWKEVNLIREAMRNGGVMKKSGWSWVEHEGHIHKFIVGDRSHEISGDIYRLLGEINMKMNRVGYMADKSCVLKDVEEEEKEEMVGSHSEKLAVCFALIVSEAETVIRVVKNLRICWDCHRWIKMISKIEGREIIVRDNNRFHCFKDGVCSCKDYW